MVQRKAVNKLGIQAESRKDHVKSDKWSMSLKPSSQHQDIKNKGGSDLKKKMKKARSFKGLDLETSLGSPFNISSHSTTPQEKPSLIKIASSYGSPNYMKPTSSWDARKEGLKVNPHSRTSSNSKFSKNSDTASLKPMKKILRKTSSLKPIRSSMKKTSSLVGSYPNQNVNRATCSSTLKDSKFPEFVALHPGSTESDGISIIKVCPYTYCSLNGHHHAPLPPLKRFLSARRRLLRTQKSMMFKGVSPHRIKSYGERKEDIDTGQMDAIVDPTVLDEVGIDFFVEIYARSREEIGESVKQDDEVSTRDEDDEIRSEFAVTHDGFDEILFFGDDEIPNGYGKAAELEVVEDGGVADLDQNSDFFAEEMDILMSSPEIDYDLQVEFPGIEISFNLIQSAQVETSSNSCVEGESGKDFEVDESISEASDMDWEEQVTSYPDNETDFSTFSGDGSDPLTATLPGNKDLRLYDELFFKQDDSVSECEETPSDGEILQEVYEEDAGDFFESFGSGDSEGDGNNIDGDHTSETGVIMENEQNDFLSNVDVIYFPLLSASTEVPDEISEVSKEENGNHELDTVSLQVNFILGYTDELVTSLQDDKEINELEIVSSVLEGETSESIESEAEQEEFTSHDNPEQALGTDDEDGLEKTDQVEDATGFLKIEIFVSHQDYSGAGQDLTNEDQSLVQTMESELCLGDEKKCSQETLVDPNSTVLHQNVPPKDEAERAEQVEDSSSLHEIEISIPGQDYSGTVRDIANEDHSLLQTMQTSDCHCDEKKSSEEALGDLSRTIPDQSDIGTIVNSQEHSEKDQREHEGSSISSSPCFEECNITEKSELISSEDCNGSDDKMKIEDDADSEATIISAAIDSNQSLPMTHCDLKGITNRKGKWTIEDSEEIRKLNLKEPRYLTPEPDPEAEKVDLRHQMMDERKSSEEWMIDYALRRAVTKLAPSQKRRVSLLVQAFETVIPVPKYETHLRHATTRFTHAIPVQACS